WPAALLIEGANGAVAALGLLAIQDLCVRAAPRGNEALGYAIVIAVSNLGVALSEVIGTRISTGLSVSFPMLVVISAATTAVTALGVPLLPRELLTGQGRSD